MHKLNKDISTNSLHFVMAYLRKIINEDFYGEVNIKLEGKGGITRILPRPNLTMEDIKKIVK